MKPQEFYAKGTEHLVDVIQRLSLARSLDEIIGITRKAARELTGADGATFVLREDELCYYAEEDAIGPLWKGFRFPMSACVSGWVMLNKKTAAIKDIYNDPRVPADAYRPTFVKSLLMVPIRVNQPIGAIGNYWATQHEASPEQIKLLEVLANSTSIALENVQLYTELKASNSFLEDSIQARDEFFSIASHELRTPLSSLKLQLQMTDRRLKKNFEALSETKGQLDLSLRQVDKLATLVEQLLDVSRIRLGKLQMDYAKVNCSELIRRVVHFYLAELEQAGCEVSLDIEDEVIGEWDGLKLEQVLSNLLSNVLKHAAGAKLGISLKMGPPEIVTLKVKDDGPGISEEVKERLFSRFTRGHAPRHLGGLGLGLFIAKSLVEAHRGEITVESALSRGTQFNITLPVVATG